MVWTLFVLDFDGTYDNEEPDCKKISLLSILFHWTDRETLSIMQEWHMMIFIQRRMII